LEGPSALFDLIFPPQPIAAADTSLKPTIVCLSSLFLLLAPFNGGDAYLKYSDLVLQVLVP
jgi:hypothetical protein